MATPAESISYRRVLFSLPELVFINIRKGSLAFAPRRWMRDNVYVGLKFDDGTTESGR